LSIKIICQNKKAYHDYHIDETIEAGLVLEGNEVKSLREGKANIRDSYARIIGEEIFLVSAHISPYTKADSFRESEPRRTRKLLLHKKEIKRLTGKTREKGITLVPTKMYFKNGRAKIELGLAKGKKLYDKRETIKKKDLDRDMARALRERNKE
jgi:SsrA-binding protein